MYLIYNNVVRRALRFTVQCSPLSQVMIPFHLARVTNAIMLSLAVYLVHQDKSAEQGFFYSCSVNQITVTVRSSQNKGRSEFTAKT